MNYGAGFFGIKTPEFGISEAIGGLLGQGRNAQGGSNLFGGTQQAYAPQGQVTGFSTENLMGPSPVGPVGAPAGYQRPSGGSPAPSMGIPSPQQPQQSQNLGDGGYGQYLQSLDSQITGLGDQRGAQESIANNTYNQGLNTATSQYNQAQQNLDTNRQKTLRDLSTSLQQQFQQGNAALGVRGASDSSAANQYAYALTKMGNQQRGDVQGQYDQNMSNLTNTYNTQISQLQTEKNNQLQQIAQWFSEAQQALAGQKGQLAFQQSQQALSTAMQMAQQIQQQYSSRQSALDQWAANHATSFNQLAGQLGMGGQFQATIPTFQGITGGQQGANGGAAVGYGQTQQRKDLFGNPIG